MPTNAEYTQEYLDIIAGLEGDIESRRASYAYMQESTAIVHHQVVACSFLPRLYNKETYCAFKETAETAHGILCKVIERYLDDPAYRDVFSFDERLVDLILLPRGYDALLPFARVDVFLDEDTYDAVFCEFNADGSSGMNENREITCSIVPSKSFNEFISRHETHTCNIFLPWVDEFLSIYETYEHKSPMPRIAICDFLENAVVDEFKVFVELFESRGYSCTICDVRDLEFDGTRLRDGQGKPINAIWRRCVTNDIIDNWDDSHDLIEAVRAEKVALIGSFAGHIVHDKQIFKALFDPRTKAFLTEDEVSFIERTIPRTEFLDEGEIDLGMVKREKDSWIIKPTDEYGAKDVYAGAHFTEGEWAEIVDRYANGAAGSPFLVQRYITPFKTPILPSDAGIDALADDEVPREAVPYNNLSGLYLYNGTFTGVFSRLGPYPTISKDMAGITAATIWVDFDPDQTTCHPGANS